MTTRWPHPSASAGIAYTNMKALGGLRHPRPDSPNSGWRNLSFRGYADYMQTPEFAAALDALIRLRQPNPPPSCARKPYPGAATAR